jgi:hypothetical protein
LHRVVNLLGHTQTKEKEEEQMVKTKKKNNELLVFAIIGDGSRARCFPGA